ncbi:MAG TPA: hypothetical protein VIL74_12665 [Pyrinomonadaceae bacterium]|jgi:peptidoglycan hydrolase-like protein with peptidoglycan-binding domain
MPKNTNTQTLERIRQLQKKLGLNDDGIIGPVTLSRIEAVVEEYFALKKSAPKPDKVETPATPPATNHFSMIVSKRALDKIVEYEVISEAAYTKKFQKPIYPGGDSGATIGIGYDLGYNTKTQIDADWRGKIADADLDLLKTAAGVKGAAAAALIPSLKSVSVPFAAAREVFYVSTLPRFAKETRGIYPGVEKLPADAQGALLSLVYNRGASLAGDRRREMKEICQCVAARNLDAIAAQIVAMKRLWDVAKLGGLHRRREEEAALVKKARTAYPPEELVKV